MQSLVADKIPFRIAKEKTNHSRPYELYPAPALLSSWNFVLNSFIRVGRGVFTVASAVDVCRSTHSPSTSSPSPVDGGGAGRGQNKTRIVDKE